MKVHHNKYIGYLIVITTDTDSEWRHWPLLGLGSFPLLLPVLEIFYLNNLICRKWHRCHLRDIKHHFLEGGGEAYWSPK